MFQRLAFRAAALASTLLFATAFAAVAQAEPAAPVEGQDYVLLEKPTATSADQIEVAEVFGYSCSHCAHFQPYADEIKSKLPAYAQFEYLPAIFNDQWEAYARAFYCAQSLGVLDKTHADMFKAVHVLRSLPVQGVTPEQFASFYAQHGVQGKQFTDMMKSFGVESRLSRAKQFAMRSQAQSTPSIVVNGKYLVTVDPKRGYAHLLNTVEHLIAQERAANQ